MSDLAIVLGPHEGGRVLLEEGGHGGIARHGQIAGQCLDLDLRTEGERSGAQGTVDLGVGVEDRLDRAAPHVGLDADVTGDHVHL